jgi:DNA-binding MarR family transcriptional regulator
MNFKKQTPENRSVQEEAMENLQLTYAWLMDQIRGFVKKENITTQQYNILRILRKENQPLSTNHIREQMHDKMSDTSRIVERMVKKGLLLKTVSQKDKRMVDVVITATGLQLLEQLDSRNYELDKILNNLSSQELETLIFLLGKLRQHQ